MDMTFGGKKAVVIGGSGGIGGAVSAALIASGASVVSVGRHETPGAKSLVLDLDYSANSAIVMDSIRDADVLCVVRGPFLQKPLDETGPDEWASVVYANLTFPGMLVSAVLPQMKAKKWGRILLFGGTRTDSVRGFKTNAAYAAAKTGLCSLVKSVTIGYARDGITCNAVCPGFVDTEYLSSDLKEALAGKNPDGKLILTQEIADSALFLMKNSVYNGVVLSVDKGWSPAFI